MLVLAQRNYRLVRQHSGFHCILNPLTDQNWSQVWRIEAHFVPDDDCPACAPWDHWEYLRISLNPLAFLQVNHWHELERIDLLNEESGVIMVNPHLENLLADGTPCLSSMELDELRTVGRDQLALTLEAEGEVLPASQEEDGPEECPFNPAGEFRLRESLPLASLTVAVPLNAADPLAAAKGIAQRELGISQIRGGKIKHFDPKLRSLLPGGGSHHEVTLQVGS